MANGNDPSLTPEDRLLIMMLADDLTRRLLLLPKAPMRDLVLDTVRWALKGTPEIGSASAGTV